MEEMVTKNRPEKLLWIAGSTSTFPVIIYGWFYWSRWSDDPQRWADYGTYLSGTAGVLVGAFGLIALLMTLRLQIESRRSADAAYARDKLETHVFQFISRLGTILSETDIRRRGSGHVLHTGRDAFRFYYKKLRGIYQTDEESADTVLVDRDLVRRSFDSLYRSNGSDFGHYFRTLYRCIRLIDRSTVDSETKENLIALVMAGLSKFELLLFFYNGS